MSFLYDKICEANQSTEDALSTAWHRPEVRDLLEQAQRAIQAAAALTGPEPTPPDTSRRYVLPRHWDDDDDLRDTSRRRVLSWQRWADNDTRCVLPWHWWDDDDNLRHYSDDTPQHYTDDAPVY